LKKRKEEPELEVIDAEVAFTVQHVNEDGAVIEGTDTNTINLEDTYDLNDAVIEIEDYEFLEARIGDTAVKSLIKNDDLNEEEHTETVTYAYVTSNDETIEVTEDTTISLVYESTVEYKTEFTYTSGNMTVTAYVSEEAKFTDDVTLIVNEVPNNTDEFNEAVEKVKQSHRQTKRKSLNTQSMMFTLKKRCGNRTGRRFRFGILLLCAACGST